MVKHASVNTLSPQGRVSITTYGSVVVELVRGFMVKLALDKSHIGVGWEVGVYIRVCLGFNF